MVSTEGLKILNLYAGIGGNRKLWGNNCEITAVENDPAIARAYQDRFPSDTIVVEDAQQYLLEHFKKFDFIWASPPCQTHSRIRKNIAGKRKPVYPDMSLYQIILFLKHYYKGLWVVENVQPYYTPLIKPSAAIDRHLYWSNFYIPLIQVEKMYKIELVTLSLLLDFDLSKYKEIKNKQQVIRNQVNYEIGLHILKCAINYRNKTTEKYKQGSLFDYLDLAERQQRIKNVQ